MWKFQQCHRGVCSWPAFVANAGEGWRRGGKNDRPSVLLLSFNTDEDCPQKKNKNKPTNKRSPGLPLTFIQLEQRHVFGKASLIRRRPIEPKRTGLASVTQSCYNLEQFFPRTELETHVKIKTTLVIIAHNIWEPGCLIGELHSERIGGGENGGGTVARYGTNTSTPREREADSWGTATNTTKLCRFKSAALFPLRCTFILTSLALCTNEQFQNVFVFKHLGNHILSDGSESVQQLRLQPRLHDQ